jgi:hypothetical protein
MVVPIREQEMITFLKSKPKEVSLEGFQKGEMSVL